MAKNTFTELGNIPSQKELSDLVNEMSYVKLKVDQLPDSMKGNKLTEKFNSVILCCSGNTACIVYSGIGIRPDGNEIDEHPFVFYYDRRDPSRDFGGIVHHGDWDGRTTDMSNEQLSAIEASGLTANFRYKGIPSNGAGSLQGLHEKGMLKGVSKQFEILLRRKNAADES